MPDVDSAAVDAYIASQPAEVQGALKELRRTIKEAAPEAIETISYQVPTYKLNGPLVSFAVAKNYCSFYLMSTTATAALKDDLQPYEQSGTSLHFTPENPLPTALIKKIVATRSKENQAKGK